MNFVTLLFCFSLIMAFMRRVYAHGDLREISCMFLNCDAEEYKPVCGGLDVESSQGFVNECALQIYNCQHETEWVVQTEVECEVAIAESASGYISINKADEERLAMLFLSSVNK